MAANLQNWDRVISSGSCLLYFPFHDTPNVFSLWRVWTLDFQMCKLPVSINAFLYDQRWSLLNWVLIKSWDVPFLFSRDNSKSMFSTKKKKTFKNYDLSDRGRVIHFAFVYFNWALGTFCTHKCHQTVTI